MRWIDHIKQSKVIAYCKKHFKKERCKRRLAQSIAIGAYIAFCPFVGFHTMLTFLSAWLFALNMPLLFLISCGLNNPWTMIPIYVADHWIGQWVFTLFSIDSFSYNPLWVEKVNRFIWSATGVKGLSLWAFLVGGNILAILIALGLYLFCRILYRQSWAAS